MRLLVSNMVLRCPFAGVRCYWFFVLCSLQKTAEMHLLHSWHSYACAEHASPTEADWFEQQVVAAYVPAAVLF
jgi:hypothetical protein